MAKPRKEYICNNCSAVYAAWSGRCLNCGEWNTIEEQLVSSLLPGAANKTEPLVIDSIKTAIDSPEKRYQCQNSEINELLGGGVVAGSVSLLGGQPGIGKSTLLLQLAGQFSANVSTLYVSGEESAHQIGLRAARLASVTDKLKLATTSSADSIIDQIRSGKFKIIIIDSIQTIATNLLGSAMGSVSQITGCTRLIVEAAKEVDVAVIIVGHVTKEGNIAGPKLLEHLVDVVLQLEGDNYGGYKILRSSKNRYGSTSEVALLEMTQKGLEPVLNPSKALLAERQITDGSVVLATIEGSRPLLVEIQALVNKTSYGYPKRTASGISLNRLNLLIAVIEKRTKLSLSDKDIFINVVGGLTLSDPAADLAICMAIASASKSLKLRQNAVVYGEVGLSGEIRSVSFIEKRLSEAQKLGFELAIGPRPSKTSAKLKIKTEAASDLRSALNQFLKS